MSLGSTNLLKKLKGLSVNNAIKKLADEKIGSGVYRDVYSIKGFPDFVMKVERNDNEFANVAEWLNWINNKDCDWLSGFLAPCEAINKDGSILIQRRIKHGNPKNYPRKIPIVITDIKASNFGFIDDQFVCCDYAFMPTYIGGVKNKMRSVKW